MLIFVKLTWNNSAECK